MAHQHVASSYMEHGACFSWEPGLVWLHVISDIVTGIAYYSIPAALFYFAYKRRDLPFHGVILLFGIFILSCGTTHFLAAYTVFVADYWIEGGVKAFTALISAVAAVYMIPLIPDAIAMPSLTRSLKENKELNAQLEKIIDELNAKNLAVEKSEERFRLLFDSAMDGILLVDMENMQFKMGNRTICTMLGYSWEEISHLGVTNIHPEENLPHVIDAFERQARGELVVAPEMPMRRKDGSVFHADIATTHITFGDRRYMVGYFRDVTRERTLQKQVQTAQRMESVGTLAGGIAHDFNNVLTVIIGYGEMLKLRIANDPKAISDLEQVLHSAERASVLTRQLLTFARRQVIDPANLDLNEVTNGLVKLLRNVTRENIELRTSLAERVPTIRADQGQVEQVLMNLALNARDAMPGGGQLVVETEEDWVDEEYVKQYPYMKAGRYAVLSVSDTGIGMDEGTRERIFEPFFTTKGPDKGTGLGLAVVYGVVKQHNGFVHVYSEPGKGTTFRIYFPAVDAPADTKVVATREIIHGGNETILLAEDNESVRHLAEQTLNSYGYRVLTACDGEEAVGIFRRHGKEIAIVVLDMVMPNKGGKQAYDEMIATIPGIKAIFMSGYSADAIHDSFVLHPGIPFLQKPFGPGMLARKVREVLDGK